ncbi:hypothetical protein A4E84_00010 [Streptomyces qaidamensis]|uniref:Uncharacterized protein n=1 Tax=Streptomyces qaidamensis TaxID=1783515 RepID=A0A143BT72_9ACTN|nr:hypothetical protein [Streptomyces qaidamensis]AMW08080.1 hypothetical protein A4E84_00010 [Streptomyces qaidamensis]
MTDLPFSSEPQLRPHKITRKNVDELLRRVNLRFDPSEISLSTRYAIPRAQRGADDNRCVTAAADTLLDLLNHPRITRFVTSGSNVVLTNLTLKATHPDREISVEMTSKGVFATVKGTDEDWVDGRCEDLRHALGGDHASWALWRPSRRRRALGFGLALDVLTAATGWGIAGSQLQHLWPALVLGALLLVIPTVSMLVGSRLVRCHLRIGHTDPTWFWQRWTVSEKLALASVTVAVLAILTQQLTNSSSTEGHHAPSRAPNTAVSSELP